MKRIGLWLKYLALVMGEGDYARYCEHMRARHPGAPVASQREFHRLRMEEKYSRPSRCC